MTKARDLANSAAAFASVSATELGYVDGVTSAIQTQMDAKAPSSTAVTLTGTQTLTNKTLTSPVIASVVNNTLTSTTGDIIYASAANTPARLGIGTTGQVLNVASGVPAWTTTAASGVTLITRQTFSNVANTGTTFDGVFTSAYKTYMFEIENMYAATSANDLYFQLRFAGPTTRAGGAYVWNNLIILSNGTQATAWVRGTSQWQLSRNCEAAAYPLAGNYWINKVGNSAEMPLCWGTSGSPNSEEFTYFVGQEGNATNYTGFILSSSSSNITGTVSVYGMA